MKTIWLVVPCYNEEEVLPETSRQLKAVMNSMIERGKISPESKITFVNDGSKDGTWDIIRTSERPSRGTYDRKEICRRRYKP